MFIQKRGHGFETEKHRCVCGIVWREESTEKIIYHNLKNKRNNDGDGNNDNNNKKNKPSYLPRDFI